MNHIPPVLREKRIIESFDVDVSGRLKPQNLLAFLLNAAWNHAKKSAYGYEELSRRNQMWVLMKIQLRIREYPRWGDQVAIETWGKRVERLFALRDFTVHSRSGETLVSASSAWLMLDKGSGRPQRFDPSKDGFPWQEEKNALDTDVEKVGELQNGAELARFRVQFSDIDVNLHVNSTRYLQWILDAHPHEYLEANVPRSIDMSFLSEALPRDEVTVFSGQSEGGELCSVKRGRDGRELCRARLEWRAAG
jgi:acyl-ACP thioesterase